MEIVAEKKRVRRQRTPEERRAYWDRLKADPVRWAAHQAKSKVKRRAKYLENPEAFHARSRAWVENNPERAKELRREQYARRDKKKMRETTREWFKKKYDSDPVFRSMVYMRNRLRDLVRGICKTSSAMDMVGCSPEAFKAHIERQFKPGMTWENYGYETWHVDHIRPLATYDLNDPEERRKAFHWTNLQPMWGLENIRKSKYAIPDEYVGAQFDFPLTN